MRRLYVRLDDPDIEQVIERAVRERRHPSDEAAVLLLEALRAKQEREAVEDAREYADKAA